MKKLLLLTSLFGLMSCKKEVVSSGMPPFLADGGTIRFESGVYNADHVFSMLELFGDASFKTLQSNDVLIEKEGNEICIMPAPVMEEWHDNAPTIRDRKNSAFGKVAME